MIQFLQHEMGVQRVIFVVLPALIIVGLPLLLPGDAAISANDPAISDNGATGGTSKTSNSSASATVTIKMYTGDDE